MQIIQQAHTENVFGGIFEPDSWTQDPFQDYLYSLGFSDFAMDADFASGSKTGKVKDPKEAERQNMEMLRAIKEMFPQAEIAGECTVSNLPGQDGYTCKFTVKIKVGG